MLPPRVSLNLFDCASPEEELSHFPAPDLKKLVICGETCCNSCACCGGSREGSKLAQRSDSWSQWCATSQSQDELERLLGFFKACTAHRKTAELLGGIEELVLKGFRKRGVGNEAVHSELAAALLASCGSLRSLVLDNATVLGSTFYERLAAGRDGSCSSSANLVERHMTDVCQKEKDICNSSPGLVEGHVRPVCHQREDSCSTPCGPKEEHADPMCHQKSREGGAAASMLQDLHIQGIGNGQGQSIIPQVPAPAKCSSVAAAPRHEDRDGQDQRAASGTQEREDSLTKRLTAASSSSTPLHTLKLPTIGCMCFQPELRAIAGMRSLQHLQLGQAGVYQRRSSFDLSALSSLTSLRTLQLACDSEQVGWAAVLSCCSKLTHLEVNHGCPFRLPDFHQGRSTSLQCLVVSHCLSFQFLPHLVMATSANFKQIVLLNKATWRSGVLLDLAGPSPEAVHERLTSMHVAWGPAGLIIDSVSRAVVLPCATPLAKLEPLLGSTLVAKRLQVLQLENVAFEANEMTSLAVLFPCLRALALESCVLDRCWAVYEAVKGWDDLEALIFIGNDHTTSSCSTTEASLPSIAALLCTRALDHPLHIAYHLYHGVHNNVLDHIQKVQAGLASSGALITWRIDEQQDD